MLKESDRQWFRDLVRSSGLTIAETAAALDLPVDTIASWRCGRRSPCCIHAARAVAERLLWAAAERDQDRAEAGK